MAEHAIPQDILNYEFKLFAGLTWKQFVYVGIGVTFGIILIQGSVKGYIPVLIGWPIGILTIIIPLALALVKVQERSLEQWLLDAIRVFNTPLLRAWMKEEKAIPLKKALDSKPKEFPEYTYEFLEPELDQEKSIFGKSRSTSINPQVNVQTNLQEQKILKLTPENASQFAVKGVTLPQIPNTIAFLIQNQTPVNNVTALLKNSSQQIIKQLKSTDKGIIYFNESLPNGIYFVEFKHDSLKFPIIQVEMTGFTYPLIKITPLLNE